jgi:signal transduction histidine kinase
MRKRSLTERWLGNSFFVTSAITLVVVVAVAFFIHSSYYDAAELALKSHAQSNSLTTFFAQYINNDKEVFHEKAIEYLDSFTDKSRIEVWVIDQDGKVVATCSGFDATEIPEYKTAIETNSNALWSGKSASGEKIMALTAPLLSNTGYSGAAVRYITSLAELDQQFVQVILLLFLIYIIINALVASSGLFFIRSIVKPVEQVAKSAKTVAAGNYKTYIKVDSRYSDEVSDLCHTFNEMIEAIGEYDQMKTDFMSTVSHELRTPLTAIRGWSETVSACPEDEETVRYAIDIILKETQNLNMIVEDLLDFSRIDGGRMKLKLERLDGVAELTDAVSTYVHKAENKNLKLIYEENDIVAPIFADALRIRQVFANIIDNAIKYTDEGTITVSGDVIDDEFVVSVIDTGCGIAADALPRIKEKFYKANMNKKGSGIGLAVSDEIVKMHDGRLTVESEIDVGTTVKVYIPLSKQ